MRMADSPALWFNRGRMHRFLLSLAAGAVVAATAPAQSSTFTKVADTSTAIPSAGGSDTFTSFSGAAAVDSAGHVAFVGNGPSGRSGVYANSGGSLVRVADTTVGGGGFTFFNNTVTIDAGNVGLRANDASSAAGLYVWNGSTLTQRTSPSTAIPSGSGNFEGFGSGYLRGSSMAFLGNNSDFSQQGIYISDGTPSGITKIADKTTTIPGVAGSYGWSSELAYGSDGNLAFAANTSPGVMTLVGGYSAAHGLVTLASTATTVPGLAVTFTSFTSPPDLDGSTVYLKGAYSGGSGIYAVDIGGGALSEIVDTATLAPGAGTLFTSFSGFAVDGGRLVFVGNYSGGSGLYAYDGSGLDRLVGTGDLIDGLTVTSLVFGTEGLAGNELALRVGFSGGASGIYTTELAAVPEPAACALLAGVAVLGLVAWRRRRVA